MGTINDVATLDALSSALTDRTNPFPTCLTEFHVTGFSRFHNVPINPTEQVANYLPKYIEIHPLRPGSTLVSTQVMKVAAETTRVTLQDLYSKLHHLPPGEKVYNNRRIVFVHMGVNACAKRFQLEIQGKNEATFSCADELGWTPIKQQIDPDAGDMSAVCRTTLRVPKLVHAMCERGFDVEESMDAGRFVCNWVYFNSLRLAEKCSGAHALFVHVPPASVASVKDQTEFMAHLLDVIAEMD